MLKAANYNIYFNQTKVYRKSLNVVEDVRVICINRNLLMNATCHEFQAFFNFSVLCFSCLRR